MMMVRPRRRWAAGALRVRVSVATTAGDPVACHLRSKLLSYPGNRFNPRDEGDGAAAFGVSRLDVRPDPTSADAWSSSDASVSCQPVESAGSPAGGVSSPPLDITPGPLPRSSTP